MAAPDIGTDDSVPHSAKIEDHRQKAERVPFAELERMKRQRADSLGELRVEYGLRFGGSEEKSAGMAVDPGARQIEQVVLDDECEVDFPSDRFVVPRHRRRARRCE